MHKKRTTINHSPLQNTNTNSLSNKPPITSPYQVVQDSRRYTQYNTFSTKIHSLNNRNISQRFGYKISRIARNKVVIFIYQNKGGILQWRLNHLILNRLKLVPKIRSKKQTRILIVNRKDLPLQLDKSKTSTYR